MESVLQDLRFTARQLLKNKSFTLTAVLSLALGIGATTAVFSVVYGVLMDPYPYKDAKRMVHVELFDKEGRQMGLVFNTGAELNDLKQAKCVDEIFMQGGNTVTMTGTQPDTGLRAVGRIHAEPLRIHGSSAATGPPVHFRRLD